MIFDLSVPEPLAKGRRRTAACAGHGCRMRLPVPLLPGAPAALGRPCVCFVAPPTLCWHLPSLTPAPTAPTHRPLQVTFRAAGTSLSGQAITDSVLLKISHTGRAWRSYEVHGDGRWGPWGLGRSGTAWLGSKGCLVEL